MTIQYASDLHLEFSMNKGFLKSNPLKPGGDILLLAGDIVPFAILNKHMDFFDFVSDHFQTTYWIPGNHEYYNYDVSQRSGAFQETIRKNVILLNNFSISHDTIRFVFSTLWSKISSVNRWQIESGMSDFQVIKYNGYRFSADQFNLLHKESLDFIKQEQKTKHTGKTIIVTHHVPTFFNYPERYKGDALNEAFAVELFDMIETAGYDYWIYGHTHYNTPNFNIGNTSMLTNQLGYVKYNEQTGYNSCKTFECVK